MSPLSDMDLYCLLVTKSMGSVQNVLVTKQRDLLLQKISENLLSTTFEHLDTQTMGLDGKSGIAKGVAEMILKMKEILNAISVIKKRIRCVHLVLNQPNIRKKTPTNKFTCKLGQVLSTG